MVGINEIRPALEAILFAAGDSVETERIAKVLGAEPWDVRQAAEQLAREYEENGRGFRLARMENRLTRPPEPWPTSSNWPNTTSTTG